MNVRHGQRALTVRADGLGGHFVGPFRRCSVVAARMTGGSDDPPVGGVGDAHVVPVGLDPGPPRVVGVDAVGRVGRDGFEVLDRPGAESVGPRVTGADVAVACLVVGGPLATGGGDATRGVHALPSFLDGIHRAILSPPGSEVKTNRQITWMFFEPMHTGQTYACWRTYAIRGNLCTEHNGPDRSTRLPHSETAGTLGMGGPPTIPSH